MANLEDVVVQVDDTCTMQLSCTRCETVTEVDEYASVNELVNVAAEHQCESNDT